MSDPSAFLAARLDEDEAAAKAALDALPVPQPDGGFVLRDYAGDRVPDAMAAHIARHDPARVLREVAAKRAILALYEAAREFNEESLAVATLQTALVIFAAVYGDHPDYEQEWKAV